MERPMLLERAIETFEETLRLRREAEVPLRPVARELC
jgi:hypothetical protein